MFDMMLGPLGQTYWAGPPAMPRVQFHHDWSRVAFIAGPTVTPLDAFSYAISTQQPAAIAAAIAPGLAATINDTSLSTPDALSRDCIATHLGVTLADVSLSGAAVADVVITLPAIRMAITRLMIRVFYAERGNEEFVGMLEDLPSGKGFEWSAWNQAAAPIIAGSTNGWPQFANIRPLPQPLPCEAGKTYFRVTFEPTTKGVGITMGTVTSLYADVYGIMPPRTPPREASQVALAALAAAG